MSLVLACAMPSSQAAGVDFVRDIRPILSDHCFACHGPDDKARKGGLRLDLKEDAFKAGKSGQTAIVPGKPAESELIRRVSTADEDDLMPPAKFKKPLSRAQVETLSRWVAEGANYQVHWAFERPLRPAVPEFPGNPFVKNPIDAFVLSTLKAAGLAPSPEADRPTLLRRVALDLTGLPPSPREVQAFVQDKDPDAYGRAVEKLLKSERYGENMVRGWLDAARYADSHGFHIDSQRDIWAYRDWVIRAFNENKPFDQFTIEQLAGDLLPGATREQKIATGYVRCSMSTGEGGAIEAEYQAKYAFDRLETTGAIWLGLTLTCARCHSHKYDPISHQEYYGLLSFFNQMDEPVMDGNQPRPEPILKLPSPTQSRRQQELKARLEALEKSARAPSPRLDDAQQSWSEKWHQKLSPEWSLLTPLTATSRPKATNQSPSHLEIRPDGAVLASGPNPEQDLHELRLRYPGGTLSALRLEAMPHASLPHSGPGRSAEGEFKMSEIELEWSSKDEKSGEAKPKSLKLGRAFSISDKEGADIAKAVDGKSETGWSVPSSTNSTALFVLGEPWEIPSGSELIARLRFEASTNRLALGHYRISASTSKEMARRLIPRFYDPWQQIGPFPLSDLSEAFARVYPPEEQIDLKAAYRGTRGEIKWGKRDYGDGAYHELVHEIHGVHGVYYLHRVLEQERDMDARLVFKAHEAYKVWLNGELVAWSTNRSPQAAKRVEVKLRRGENRLLCKVVSEATSSGFAFKLEAEDENVLPPDVAGALALSAEAPKAQRAAVRDHFRRQESLSMRRRFREIEVLKEEQQALEKSIPTTLIAKELAKPRETFLLVRGEYDKKGDKIEPHVPALLHAFPSHSPSNRLGLARWLVDPANPLTPRVTVNRLWQQLLGVGLVKTSEDFGVQSERPSHPELLDWLAVEYVSSGWDTKHLLRLILNSSTYRQTSQASAELRARDPENRLLARGPRFRVDAEVLRDVVLAVSGLLVEKVGGPPARPFEPGGLWEAVSFNNVQRYVVDVDQNQYRRGIYTNWKRQSPPPAMLAFDAPTREYCVMRRPRTNTPLQALAMLNDPQYVEASNAFAERILEQGGANWDSRIRYAFQWATGRRPEREEIMPLREVFEGQLEEYRRNPAAVEALLSVRSFRPGKSWNRAELAAWSSVSSVLLNLDETLTKN